MTTLDNRSWKEKVKDAALRAQMKIEDAGKAVAQACKDHPAESFALAIACVPLVNKALTVRKERAINDRRELDKYDPRTGEHWILRRKMRKGEQLELERRYANGESKGEILRSMRLL